MFEGSKVWLIVVALALAVAFAGSIVGQQRGTSPASDNGSPSDREVLPTGPAGLTEEASAAEPSAKRGDLIANLTIFILATFIGFEVINKVPPTLHTPLMSGSNAISGITIVGAIVIAGSGLWGLEPWTGFFAAILAMINVVGGFLVTHRMLMMFKRK